MQLANVVIDEGSGQIKAAWLVDGKIVTDCLPSRIGRNPGYAEGGGYSDSTYKVDDRKYNVSLTVDNAVETNDPEYQTSKYNRIMCHEMLRKNGFGGQSVSIATTLPIEDFFLPENHDEPINKNLIQKKRDNLNNDLENMAGHALASIEHVSVFPEAIPAWHDYRLNENGEIILDVDETYQIMVVDLGGTTSDVTVINGIGVMQKIKSVRGGVFEVSRHLGNMIRKDFDREEIHFYQLDNALRSATFDGKDISQQIRLACEPVEELVIKAMRDMVRDSKRLNAVLYVGGGASIMAKSLASQYGGKTIIGDEFSIARGILKRQRELKRLRHV